MEIFREIESIIFLSGDGVKIKDLAKFYSKDFYQMLDILAELKETWKSRGINLDMDSENVYFITNPYSGEAITNFFEQESKPKKLSAAALETISIVAYRQPVTKSQIENIRGVAVDRILQTLEEKKFVNVCGRLDSPGKPKLYEITDKFLAYIGITKVEELPEYEKMRGVGKNGEDANQ